MNDNHFLGVSRLVFLLVFLSGLVQVQGQTIQVDTKLVNVPVTVRDRNGLYVTNLKKGDFRVFEDGIEQEVEFFEPVEESFVAMLLLDRSGSMSGQYRVQLTKAANIFVKELRPDDELIAATFADSVVIPIDRTKVGQLKKAVAIGALFSDTTTLIYDAVDTAFRKLKKVKGRKAVILFSDGVGDGTFSSAKANLRDAEEGEAIVYTIHFDTSSSVPEEFKTRRFYEGAAMAKVYMQELSRLSGGRYFEISDISDLPKKFGEIANELGRQYRLGYYPVASGKDGERRKITVKVNVPNVAVRSRNEVVYRRSKK